MSIREEIEKCTIGRDLEILLMYFGFSGGEAIPTLASIGKKFKISRERVRQIVKNQFTNKFKKKEDVKSELKQVVEAYQFLVDQKHLECNAAMGKLIEKGLVENDTLIHGLINLFAAANLPKKLNVYGADFKKIYKNLDQPLFIVTAKYAEHLVNLFVKVKVWPGQPGLADLDHCLKRKKDNMVIKEHLNVLEEVVTVENKGRYYYIVENRPNAIVHALESIYSLGDVYSIESLSKGIIQSFNRQNKYPEIEVVEEYLKKTKLLSKVDLKDTEGNLKYKFQSKTIELSNVEKHLHSFMQKQPSSVTFTQIRNHLQGQNVSLPWVSKLVKKPWVKVEGIKNKYLYSVIE